MKRTIASLLAIAWLGSSYASLSGTGLEMPSLKNGAAAHFEVGFGIRDRMPQRTNDWPLLLAQFIRVTPGNCLKPAFPS